MRLTIRRAFGAFVAVSMVSGVMLSAAGGAAAAPPPPPSPVPVPDEFATLDTDPAGTLAPALRNAKGTVTVSVALSRPAVAATVPDQATSDGQLPSVADQRAQTAGVRAQQSAVLETAAGLGARAVGRATTAANVVAVTVPADNLSRLAAIPGVVSVKPVGRYETQADPTESGGLAQAADYLRATEVRRAGYDGTGVKVAVLDSGIDYTHKYLGGPGTEQAYTDCYEGASGTAYNAAPVGRCADLFGPSAPKVKGGYDFVGETWPNTAERPDPNPIDFDGHGTHVSDIIGGRSADGTHQGIAPGVDLYAVRVCSAVSTSCSGVAILEGIDWALDPNGDGDISDAMDIVNLSLGSPYGQAQDDATVALNNLVRAGVVAVVSAGNSADRPFIVGSPSTAERAISVAQTALPDDKQYALAVDSPTIAGLPGNAVRNMKLQTWSPLPGAALTAPLAQPTGTREGCTTGAFTGFPAGAVALVKRGACNASAKAQNAQAAGAAAVVIWNNVPGDPPDFSFGGGPEVTVPTFTISFADGTKLSDAVAAGPVSVTIDPAAATSLANTTVGTSSRGLAISGQRAKPDIGAPGAWLSAAVGTGNGQTNFGGTSGAAPVISGAAALVLDRYPSASPTVVKSRLLNNASTDNRTPDAVGHLYATPISRVGAGEVRIAPAVNAAGVLVNSQFSGGGNIGLGMPKPTTRTTSTVVLKLRNTASTARSYQLTPTFRDPADAASRAVTVHAPRVVRVPARGTAQVKVAITIDPAKLDLWPFTHSAGFTGDGSALNAPEFDGYLLATSGAERLHLGWTVLPQRSADVSAAKTVRLKNGVGTLSLANRSRVLDGAVDVFALTGTSPRLPKPGAGEPGSPGSNAALIDLAAAGVRDSVTNDLLQFAIAGQQRQTIPLYPAGYEVDIDTNRDGVVDYAVFQQEAVGPGSSGQSLVYVLNVATKRGTAYYYTDANFNASTQVFSVPLSALGLAKGSTFDFDVLAYDNYFSGNVTDVIEGQRWTVGSPKYSLNDSLVVPAKKRLSLTVRKNANAAASTQTGFLLLFDDAAGRDAQAVRLTGN